MSKATLQQLLQREDLTIEELVTSAEALLRELAPTQTRYKVSERPDVRTIRYYTSQNLLPRPLSYAGGRARYGGAHLARLLLIKKLQAEHHTLQHIKRRLQGCDDRDVLRALIGQADPARVVARAPAAAKPARARPAAVPTAGQAMRRVHLRVGGTLDIEQDVLDDPARRRQLVEELQRIARSLEASADDDGGGQR